MKNPHRQVVLISDLKELECNVPDHPKLKVGNVLTLKDHHDPDRQWIVIWVSQHTNDKSALRTDWNNNI